MGDRPGTAYTLSTSRVSWIGKAMMPRRWNTCSYQLDILEKLEKGDCSCAGVDAGG